MGGDATRIADSLVLRPVRDDRDVTAVVNLLAEGLNPVEGATAGCLLRHHPSMRREDFLVVEDTSTGALVSTTCLIPWTLHFCGVDLACGQVELVYTHPSQRNKGLVRKQMEHLHRIAGERGCDLVFIWGIPFYYRQYGYGYTIEGTVGELLPSRRIPDAPSGTAGVRRLRPALPADVPALCGLYDRSTAALDVRLRRAPAQWRYMVEHAEFPVQVLERPGGTGGVTTTEGYLVMAVVGGTAHVLESGIADQGAALDALRLIARGRDSVVVNWPSSASLVRLAQALGSTRIRRTQWLFRIPDPRALLAKLVPVFDRRLEASDCRALDRDIVLNLFREGYRLAIRGGRVREVQSAGFVDTSMGGSGASLSIHPDAFLRLLMGQNDLDELRDAWPDLVLRPEDRPVIDVLFPRLNAYLYTPYHAYGAAFASVDDRTRRSYV